MKSHPDASTRLLALLLPPGSGAFEEVCVLGVRSCGDPQVTLGLFALAASGQNAREVEVGVRELGLNRNRRFEFTCRRIEVAVVCHQETEVVVRVHVLRVTLDHFAILDRGRCLVPGGRKAAR